MFVRFQANKQVIKRQLGNQNISDEILARDLPPPRKAFNTDVDKSEATLSLARPDVLSFHPLVRWPRPGPRLGTRPSDSRGVRSRERGQGFKHPRGT